MSNTFRINITEPVVPTSEPAPSFIVTLSDGKTLGKYSNGETVPAQPSLQEQLQDIGQEVIEPSYTLPYVILTLGDVSTKEVGFPYSNTLTATFNRGAINGTLVEGIWQPLLKQNDRSGIANNYNIETIDLGLVNTLDVNLNLVLGSNTFSTTVDYDAGPIPTDSAGNILTGLAPGSVSDTVTINSQFKNFFGFSTNSSLTSAQIISLVNGDLDTNQIRSYANVTAGVGNYTYYCYPSSYPDLSSIILNGSSAVLGSFIKLPNVIVTNQYNIVQDYIVYRSNAINAFTNDTLNFS